MARLAGEAGFNAFLGAEADQIRNLHGIAATVTAALDGDELGYLLGKVAKAKGIK